MPEPGFWAGEGEPHLSPCCAATEVSIHSEGATYRLLQLYMLSRLFSDGRRVVGERHDGDQAEPEGDGHQLVHRDRPHGPDHRRLHWHTHVLRWVAGVCLWSYILVLGECFSAALRGSIRAPIYPELPVCRSFTIECENDSSSCMYIMSNAECFSTTLKS